MSIALKAEVDALRQCIEVLELRLQATEQLVSVLLDRGVPPARKIKPVAVPTDLAEIN